MLSFPEKKKQFIECVEGSKSEEHDDTVTTNNVVGPHSLFFRNNNIVVNNDIGNYIFFCLLLYREPRIISVLMYVSPSTLS